MNTKTFSQETLDLADASNELCTAIEILKIAHPNINSLAWKNLLKRQEEVCKLLLKFQY